MTFPLTAAALALIACLLVGRFASVLVLKMRPAQAVVLLAVISLAVSLASGAALTAIAVAVIASLNAVAAQQHWSAAVLRAEVPIPGWLGALAAVAVAILLLRAVVRTVGIVVALVRADRLSEGMRAGGGPVVIVDDGSADAFTVAGIRGCVVISLRLISALTADERRVLTAHELSHLTRRHHLYVHIADIAAAANPLLRGVSGAVRLGVERWADEDAATGIGDRRVTGRALARIALLRSALGKAAPTATRQPVVARRIPMLGVGTLQVASRVRALLTHEPRQRTGRAATAAVLSFTVLMVCLASLAHIHDAIEAAAAYLHSFAGN